MENKNLIKIPIERRTFVRGTFVGKYWSKLDEIKSDPRVANFYDLTIYEAEVEISEVLKFDEFVDPKLTVVSNSGDLILPSSAIFCHNGARFQLNLIEQQISIEKIYDVVNEVDKTFGTIKGAVSGYVIHYDYETKEIETETPPRVSERGVIIQGSKTGRFEKKENRRRDEYFNSDSTTYWGDWYDLPVPIDFSSGCFFNWIGYLPKIIFIIIILFFLSSLGWKIALPIILIGLFFILFSFLANSSSSVFKGLNFVSGWLRRFLLWIFKFIATFIIISVFFAIFKSFSGDSYSPKPQETIVDSLENTNPIDSYDLDNPNDTLISNFRKWKDYDGSVYQGYLSVSFKDYINSRDNRLNYPVQASSEDEMIKIYNRMVTNDNVKLNRICRMFDSIRSSNHLGNGSVEFANIIVSCIQDIPYTLILQGECNSSDYDDSFIRKYLNEGGDCLGNTKYGILAPIEFMAKLKGDCDTRTILLFDILSKFKYDVVVLGSYYYKHSILGISIKGDGVYKYFNNKKYYVWETTCEGMQIGQFSPEMSNMDHWSINLINSNK